MNLYAFCGNNPINFVDPMGENPLGAALGATIEGILTATGSLGGVAAIVVVAIVVILILGLISLLDAKGTGEQIEEGMKTLEDIKKELDERNKEIDDLDT